MTTVYDIVQSPVGDLLLTAEGDAITRLWFDKDSSGHVPLPHWVHVSAAEGVAARVVTRTREQLAEYFSGTRQTFHVPLAPSGSDFQQRVWKALLSIPYGETISYSELARRIGNIAAMRAVGGANARNPIAVIVPCHRVIGADGSLTGYGGGMERKRWLLEHEGVLQAGFKLQGVQGVRVPESELSGTLTP